LPVNKLIEKVALSGLSVEMLADGGVVGEDGHLPIFFFVSPIVPYRN